VTSRENRIALPTLALCAVLALAGCSASADDPESDGGSGETHAVEHARGTTDVSVDPQRVVTLEPVELDTAVALGRVPVGSTVLDEASGVPAYLAEAGPDAAAVEAIESVGTVAEPDLERIAALRPDLILGTESRHGALYDKLSAIAPTVFMATQEDAWQDNVGLVAEALGDAEGADRLLGEYDARCAEVAAEHETVGRTAQLVRPRDGLLTLYGPASFAGSTLECAGFATPERDWEDSISVDLSPELAAEAGADLVVVTAVDPDDPAAVPSALSGTAFPEVRAVDQSFWITGVGPLGGQVVLDDLDRLLTQG
jgi:iron complex transport system substrate-binding protein